MTSPSLHTSEGNELRVAIRGGLFTYRDPGRQQLFDQTFPVLARTGNFPLKKNENKGTSGLSPK